MTITIRNAVDKDIPVLSEMEKESFSLPWTAEMLMNQIHGDGRIFLVAEAEGEVCGYVGLWYVLDEGYITNVATLERFRRQGVATALINEMTERARKLKLLFLSLEVRESNYAAKNLYAGLDFKNVGKRPSYYEQPDEDAEIMTLFLK